MGNSLQSLKRYAEAEQCYRQAIAIRPEFTGAYINLGNMYREQKRYEDAAEQYAAAINRQPNHVGAHVNLAHTLVDLDQLQPALHHYEIAADLLMDMHATDAAMQIQHKIAQLRLVKPAH